MIKLNEREFSNLTKAGNMTESPPIFKFAIREDLKDTGDMFLPKKAEPYATGYDVRAAFPDRKDLVLRAGQYFKIPLGFRAFCPEGWYYQLHPRSSSFVKKSMHNLIGICDETWEGQTLLAGQYLADVGSLATDLIVKFGEPVGQIVRIKRREMKMEIITNEEFEKICKDRNASRKDGGFGSTDR
jgi:dUTPase